MTDQLDLNYPVHVCVPPAENSPWTCSCGQFFPQMHQINLTLPTSMAEHIIIALSDYAFKLVGQTSRQRLLDLSATIASQIYKETL